jgi:hypothetical protein
MATAYENLAGIYKDLNHRDHMCECFQKSRQLWHAMGLTTQTAELNALIAQSGCTGQPPRQPPRTKRSQPRGGRQSREDAANVPLPRAPRPPR